MSIVFWKCDKKLYIYFLYSRTFLTLLLLRDIINKKHIVRYAMDGRISNFEQIASVRRYTLSEGRSKGLEVIDCDNGKLRFLLNVSKACDIMNVYYKGQNVSFISKNGFTKREIPFINRFEGGMLYTCGLDSVGAREGYDLHGTLHNIPAEIVRAECNEKGIVIEAIVRDTALFGQSLVLKRRITSEIGSDLMRLEDTLINESFRDQDYCLLYHINIGYPMLDEGAKVVADIEKITPRTEWSDKHKVALCDMSSSVDNMEETCYFLKLGKPEVSLLNEKLGRRLTVSYSQESLPCFIEWKSMASGDYALGFEPCTTELDGGFEYRTLGAGESVGFFVNISVSDTER